MLAKLELYGIAAIVLLATVTGAYFYAKHQGVMEERERWEVKQAVATKADLEDLAKAVSEGNQIAKGVQDALAKAKPQRVIERGVIEREIKTDVRYATDCFPDSGRLQWNSISAGRGVLPSIPGGLIAPPGMPGGSGAADRR